MTRVLTSEQPQSIHGMLADAGVRHGDTTRVRLALGVPDEGSDHLAGCPGVAVPVRVLRSGTDRDHDSPIVGDITFTNPDVILAALTGQRGILVMTADVHCNGKVSITAVPGTPVLVPQFSAPYLRSPQGKDLARQVLQSVCA
jgi:hypothetical protein